jgi:isopentenyl-diphosphate delta-isomerase
MKEEMLVLVDEHDQEIGTAEKMEAHRSGILHRAFSVFVQDPDGNVLLQRRAAGKYHSAGLWSNTCCGHPRPGEPVVEAAERRLREEMGFDCGLEEAFTFVYRAPLEKGLVEHELDHVLTGRFAGTPRPDPSEVEEWRSMPVAELLGDVEANPSRYSAWFRPALEGLLARGRLAAGGKR